jgi:hypothetical protein
VEATRFIKTKRGGERPSLIIQGMILHQKVLANILRDADLTVARFKELMK